MKAIQVLSALTDVRDSYILDSALPTAGEALPVAPLVRRGRSRGRDRSLGRMFSEGWAVAAVCALVAVGTLGGLIYLGQNPPTPPAVSTDPPTVTLPESDEGPVTEGIMTESLVFVSHGDGTCSVKASSGFGTAEEDIHLVIPPYSPDGDRVVAVADYGFLWKRELETVTLPDTLESIGQWAFAECASLRSVELPAGLTAIGTAAFLECSTLTEIKLPEGLTTLGDSAFSTCVSLQRVTTPSTLTALPQWAFYNCAALEELTLSEGLTEIGYSAFYGCGSLTSVSIPTTVKRVGKGAFARCDGLLSITLHEGLTSLGDLAFDGCARLASVTLPATLETLGGDPFRDCSSLRTVVFTGERAAWKALIGETSPLPSGCTTHCSDGVLKN